MPASSLHRCCQPLLPLLAFALLLAMALTCQAQRHGLSVHKFFLNPFLSYPGGAEATFADSEVHAIRFTQPVFLGAGRASYSQIFLHRRIPGFVFFESPTGFPPELDFAYPKPYIKVLDEFRDKAKDEVKVYSRVVQSNAATGCLDKKFINKFKDEANQLFNFGRSGYFEPQEVVVVAFRRPDGQAMGGLAEIVFVNSGFDTVVYMQYGNLKSSMAQTAGFYGNSPLLLPTGFSGESNVAQAGSWVFRTSDGATPGGIASANVDQSLRRMLDRSNERLGFLADRLLGCPCDQCNRRAQCVSVLSGRLRVVLEGAAQCCQCRGVNSYLGNGQECADTGSPLPVAYPAYPWKSTAEGGADDLQVNISLVQANLDVRVEPAAATARLSGLVKLSEPAWSNLVLLSARIGANTTQNLFALANAFERRLEFNAVDSSTGAAVASWTIEQSVWNRVLLKATSTGLRVTQSSASLDGIVAVLGGSGISGMTTEYVLTKVRSDGIQMESRPASFEMSVLTTQMPLTLRVNFTDRWSFEPTCTVETRIGRMALTRSYETSDLPNGSHLTRLTGTIIRQITCADLACGVGAECRPGGSGVQASCHCLPGYRRQNADGPCLRVCGEALCHQKAECLLNKCMCTAGYSGDGASCSADSADCRLPAAACRAEEGAVCLQQAISSGLQYRCQCSSSKCIRDADAACRRQHGCSRFADCIAEIGVCSCRTGFSGDGKVCLPGTCVDTAACADAGQFAFCNASRLCQVCAPPMVVADGRCQERPCRQADCHRLAECNPVINRCVCRAGFAGDGVLNCSLACSRVADCNREVSAADLKDLESHMVCSEGACLCRRGYRASLDEASRILSCSNCETDTDCLPGASCQFQLRFSNARLCRCPDGKFGDGATACHECEVGGDGVDSGRLCGANADCEAMPTGRMCRCRYGHSRPRPKQGCVKDETRLLLNTTQLQLYEGQPDIRVSCRVIRGPVRPANLVWSSVREIPIPLTDEGRVAQFLLGDRKVLHIRRVAKTDGRDIYCLADVDGERGAVETLKVTVLDNPCRRCHPLAFCNYSLPGCQCSLGYTGDGVARCDRANCLEQPLCDRTTELCQYSAQTGKYSCQCAPGLERIDGRCQRRQEGCQADSDCHANAECALVDGRRQCRCREGYAGDGLRHCQRAGPGCNFYNRCVQNSECKYSPSDSKYRCICTAGYFGDGDTQCRSQASCAQCERTSGVCDFEAVQHKALDGRMEPVQLALCRCPPGSSAVQISGQAQCRTSAQLNRVIYVAQGDSILRMQAEAPDAASAASSSNGLFVAMSSASDAAAGPNAPRQGAPVVAISHNCRSGEMIWSVYGRPQLYMAKIGKDGAAASAVPFGDGMGMVEGLAVDWTTGNVFYTAQYVSKADAARGARFGEIGVIAYRRGMAYKKVLFRGRKDGVVRPRGIAVDPFLGKIYYTDWDRNDPRVMMAYMDGENHVKLLSTGGPLPNGVIRRFDSSFEEVCYAAADNRVNRTAAVLNASQPSAGSSRQLAVQCAWQPVPNAAFVERRDFRTQWAGEPFGLAYADGSFYWTNWYTNKVAAFSTRLDQSTERGPLGNLHDRLMGIAVASSEDCPATNLAQKSDHACSVARNYGGCNYICLAAPNGGAKCVCPDNNPSCAATVV